MIGAILIVIFLLAVVTALAFDLSWFNVTIGKRNELVFNEKNKSYGAFVIRRDYTNAVLLALLISVGVLGSTYAVPKLIEFFSKEEVVEDKMTKNFDVKLMEPPPMDEKTPPPPPPPP
ncbi:MAG: hypothetical protein AB1458_08975, partial [Bacteroidota bacterium]